MLVIEVTNTHSLKKVYKEVLDILDRQKLVTNQQITTGTHVLDMLISTLTETVDIDMPLLGVLMVTMLILVTKGGTNII